MIPTRDQKGLTLVELVAVMAILAILAGAASWRISASTNAARLRAGAEWTASVIRQAVRLSWAQQVPVRVQFQPGSMDVVVTVWNGLSWVDAPDFFLPGSDRPVGAIVSDTTYPSHRLAITPLSLGSSGIEASVQATEGTVTVSTAGLTMQVSTSRYGQVSISR